MKRLYILLLGILMGGCAVAQTPANPTQINNTKYYEYKQFLGVDSAFLLPQRSTNWIPSRPAIVYNPSDSLIYLWNKKEWVPIGVVGEDTSSSAYLKKIDFIDSLNNNRQLLSRSGDSIFISDGNGIYVGPDSTIFATRYYVNNRGYITEEEDPVALGKMITLTQGLGIIIPQASQSVGANPIFSVKVDTSGTGGVALKSWVVANSSGGGDSANLGNSDLTQSDATRIFDINSNNLVFTQGGTNYSLLLVPTQSSLMSGDASSYPKASITASSFPQALMSANYGDGDWLEFGLKNRQFYFTGLNADTLSKLTQAGIFSLLKYAASSGDTLAIGVNDKGELITFNRSEGVGTNTNISNTNLTQDSISRTYNLNGGSFYQRDGDSMWTVTSRDSIGETLQNPGYAISRWIRGDGRQYFDIRDRSNHTLLTRAEVNRTGLYLYTGVHGSDTSAATIMIGQSGDITVPSMSNSAGMDSIVTTGTSGIFKLAYMPHADSIMLRSDFTDSLTNSLSAGESLPRRSIKGQGGVTILNGDSTTIGDTDVVVKVPKYVAGTNVTFGGTADSVVINASGGGSGTDTIHAAKAPLTISRSGNTVTYGFDTTQFKTPTTDGRVLITGDAKMWHNAYLSLNPDSIWGAVPLGDSVSLPNTNLGNSDLSLSDAARWLNLNDGGLYVIDSTNITSPNSNYILGIDQNGLNVHWGSLKIAYTLPGTSTDSLLNKTTAGQVKAIAPSQITAGNATKLNNQNASYYLNYNNLTNTPSFSNTNLATNDLSLASAVSRIFNLNGGTLTLADSNRTYGDPVAVFNSKEIHFTTEDDAGSHSANYLMDYGTSPSITESVLADGGSYYRIVDSSGWLWEIGTTELMRLDGSGYTIDNPITIYPRSGSSASFHIGSDFISGVNYGGTGGTFKIDSVGNVTFPKYAGGASAGQVLSTDGSGGLELVNQTLTTTTGANLYTDSVLLKNPGGDSVRAVTALLMAKGYGNATEDGDGTTTTYSVDISGLSFVKGSSYMVILTPTSEDAAKAQLWVDTTTQTTTSFDVKVAGTVPPSGTGNVKFQYVIY